MNTLGFQSGKFDLVFLRELLQLADRSAVTAPFFRVLALQPPCGGLPGGCLGVLNGLDRRNGRIGFSFFYGKQKCAKLPLALLASASHPASYLTGVDTSSFRRVLAIVASRYSLADDTLNLVIQFAGSAGFHGGVVGITLLLLGFVKKIFGIWYR